jgi:hypothetical protein
MLKKYYKMLYLRKLEIRSYIFSKPRSMFLFLLRIIFLFKDSFHLNLGLDHLQIKRQF